MRIVASRGSMDLGDSDGGLPPDALAEDIDAILADTERLAALADGDMRADRRRALLAVLGHDAADGGVGRARAAARPAAAHASRRDRRGGGVLPGALRLHAGRVPRARRLARRATSGARTASTSRTPRSSASARTGVGVAHCPTSNLRLGAGIAPVRELLDAGVRVGLGVDGSASNERSDLFFEVKQALLVARGRGGGTAMTAREALRLATRGGAAVLAATTSARSSRASAPTSRSGAPTASSSAAPRTSSPALVLSGAAPRRHAARRRRGGRPRRPLVRADEEEIAREHRKARRARLAAMTISTHVLDTERGQPAAGVRVELWRGDELVGSGETDADGRIRELADAEPGTYRIVFHPPSPFFRRVELEVELGEGHHHVPLLVSSYACATYRGS